MLSRHTFWLLLLLLTPVSQATDRYLIDPEHTFSSFEYQHWGLSTQRGRFNKNSGYIDYDADHQTGDIRMEIDAASVDTGSELFNRAMRSANFFDTENYPTIRFVSDKLVFENGQLSQVEGKLTIKKTTRDVAIQVTHFACRFMILYLKQACGANGYTRILRSDYQIGRFVPFVSDEVTLSFSLEAIKDSQSHDDADKPDTTSDPQTGNTTGQ